MVSDQPVKAAKRMRIAYLTTEYPKVSHTFIRREITELERRGHSVVRLAIRHPADDIADDKDRVEDSKTIHFMKMPVTRILVSALSTAVMRPLRFASALKATVKMSRPSDRGLLRHLAYLLEAASLLPVLADKQVQHLHVHFGTNAATVAYLMRRMGGPPYSMTVHGPVEFDAPLAFSLKDKAEEATFIVAISHFCFAQLCRWLHPEHWSKIHIVHCSAGHAYFETSQRINGQSRMLLSVGRLDAQKGQFLLLDALKIVVDRGLDVRLTLVGDGELRPLLEQRIRDYHLTQHVTMTGWLDESGIIQLMQQARALVQPSFAEGLPVVIMEAFAMARPVISTHVAGIPELVRHSINGWLVPVGSVNELVSAISEVMSLSAAELDEMGQAGRESACAEHSIEGQAALLETLFCDATKVA